MQPLSLNQVLRIYLIFFLSFFCFCIYILRLIVCNSSSNVNAFVETLVVLAHGRFLHPDAAALDELLDHHRKPPCTSNTHPRRLGDDSRNKHGKHPPRQQGEGRALFQPPPATTSATTTSTDRKTTDRSITDRNATDRREMNRREEDRGTVDDREARDDDSLTSLDSSSAENETIRPGRFHGRGLALAPILPAVVAAAVEKRAGGESDEVEGNKPDSHGRRDGGCRGGAGMLVSRGKGTCMVRKQNMRR